MTEQTNKRYTLLTILVAGLLVAFVAQSLALYGMQKKLTQMDTPEPAPPAQADPASTAVLTPTPAHAQSVAQLQKNASPASAAPSVPRQPRTAAHAANQPSIPDYDLVVWDLNRWDPFVEMRLMQDQMNQMFLTAFNRFQDSDDFRGLSRDYPFAPDLNIEDKGDQYVVTVDLPGAENSQINVKYEDPLLTISGSVQSESTETDQGRILRQERRSGQFLRAVSLPGPIEADKISTKNEKGVVTITVPKAKS